MITRFETRTSALEPRGRSASRGGVTLMEVLFAIAIFVSGLAGLVVVVRFAMRNAYDTIRFDEAMQEGASADSIAQGQGLAKFDRLVVVTDDRFDLASVGPMGTAATQSGRMRLATQVRTHNPALGATGMLYAPVLPPGFNQTTPDTGMIDSPGFRRFAAPNVIQLDRFSGFCIDPMGFFRNFIVIDNSGNYSTTNALDPAMKHRIGVFPYYKPDWNPLQTPWTSSGSVLGFPLPRLWRCQIARGNSEDMVPYHVVNSDVLDKGAASRLFEFSGNPLQKTLKDQSYAEARLFESTSASVPIRSADSNRFTWFATLTPSVSASTVFNQAIVIVENRLIEDLYNNIDPAASSEIPPADDAPRGERLAWVYNAIGFDGGAGGEVFIVSTDTLSSRVRPGQWVMMSRQDYNFNYKVSPPVRKGTVTVPIGPAQHSWYRILGVEDISVPTAYPYDMPAQGTLWAKHLTLAGPDWQFNFDKPIDDMGSPITVLEDDTVMTIIDGAVEVIQSQVILE